MNGWSAHEDDMQFVARLNEREIDAILAGKAPADDPDLQAVTAFFRDVKTCLVAAPAPAVEVAHLARMSAAAGQARQRLHEQPSAAPRRNPFSPVAARATFAAAAVAAIAALGGAAYAGVLPDPVQARVSKIARNVGISLPRSMSGARRDGDVRHESGKDGATHRSGGSDRATVRSDLDPGSQDPGAGGVDGDAKQRDGGQSASANASGGERSGVGEGTQSEPRSGPASDQGDGMEKSPIMPRTPSGADSASLQQEALNERDPAPAPQDVPSESDPVPVPVPQDAPSDSVGAVDQGG